MTTEQATGHTTAGEWGARVDSMNAFESLMWRVEDVSSLRSTCVAIELLAGTPRWLDVLAAHEQLVRRAPRLRQRVVDPPRGVALPRSSFDPHFDLHFHVRRARVPGEGTWADLIEAAEVSAMGGFDRSRRPQVGPSTMPTVVAPRPRRTTCRPATCPGRRAQCWPASPSNASTVRPRCPAARRWSR